MGNIIMRYNNCKHYLLIDSMALPVKLIDFGCSFIRRNDEDWKRGAAGTAEFMAPEVSIVSTGIITNIHHGKI